MNKKLIFITISLVILIILILLVLVIWQDKTTKLPLKCSIKGDYSHFGESIWETFHGTLDSEDNYFLINLKKKTINDFAWNPLENFKNVTIDKEVISFDEVLNDNSTISYIVMRNTAELTGVRTLEDKKNNSKTFYNYKGTCERFNLTQKF